MAPATPPSGVEQVIKALNCQLDHNHTCELGTLSFHCWWNVKW